MGGTPDTVKDDQLYSAYYYDELHRRTLCLQYQSCLLLDQKIRMYLQDWTRNQKERIPWITVTTDLTWTTGPTRGYP